MESVFRIASKSSNFSICYCMADPQDLVSLVFQTAHEVQTCVPTDATDHLQRMFLIETMDAAGTAAHFLRQQLLADNQLGPLRHGWIAQPISGSIIHVHMLLFALVRAALDGEDVAATYGQFVEFATTKESTITWYAPVVGLQTPEVVELENNVALLPWSRVPEPNRHRFENDPTSFRAERVNVFLAQPSAAIRVSLPARQVLFSSNVEAQTILGEESAPYAEITRANEIAMDIVRSATVATDALIAVVGSWIELSGVANRFSPRSFSYDPAFFDFSLLASAGRPATIAPPELRQLYSALAASGKKHRDILRLSIDRLTMSLRRQDVVDTSLDLGIALEAMLLHDLPDKGELRYRIAIRGASYMGASAAERREIFGLLRKVYDQRSKAIHEGRLTGDEAAARKLVRQGTSFVGRTARRILLAGTFPEWEDYVLGAPS